MWGVPSIPILLGEKSSKEYTEDACSFMPEMPKDEIVEQDMKLAFVKSQDAHVTPM